MTDTALPPTRADGAVGGQPAEERILRATMAALAELDPAAITIKALCRAAQVTPPTIYYHFGNKDGLLASAVERLVDDWLAAVDAAVGRDTTLAVTIDQAIAAWTGAITAPSRPLAVFAWATLLLADSSEPARAALVRARDRGRGMITDVVALHVPPGPLVDTVAGLVVDSVIAAAVQYELDHDEQGLRARLAALGTAVGVLAAH
ncbi:MAG: TetR/AcrR family transcriptional regulator [Candidatus Nanopelagicales bacterium]|nr:TetR/AcrR family transcriptional regulator [Candidatus Nanopelagicales bacterium]